MSNSSGKTVIDYLMPLRTWLFRSEEEACTLRAVGHRAARIVFATVRDLISGQLTLYAMSLVYTTLLSIVPLLALSFSVLKAMGVHNQLAPLLDNFFAPLGEQGTVVAANIMSFVDNIKVGVLGFVGLGLLVYTVISLVQKIEHSFNYIWRVPGLRSIGQRFSNYLSVIMVGPLLVVSAIGATASIMSSAIVQSLLAIEPFGTLFLLAGKIMPYFFIVLAFTFVYTFMPNTRVNLRSALIGGFVGGIAWQTSGILFASVVVSSSKYQAVYSGFAIGIVLLIWLYISWLILLLGAVISYYAQNSGQICQAYRIHTSARQDERVGLAMMYRVASRYDKGERPLSVTKLERDMSGPPEVTRRVMKKLIEQHYLGYSGQSADRLVPGRSIDQISLADLLLAIRREDQNSISHSKILVCDTLVADLETQWVSHLGGLTLADLVRNESLKFSDGRILRRDWR